MTRRARILACCLLAVCTAAAVAAESEDSAKKPRMAMDFAFVDINPASATHGQEIALGEALSERGVIVNFLASWCTYCWVELPELERLFRADEANVVGIALDEGDASGEVKNLVTMLERAELTIPVLYVPEDRKAWMESFYDYQLLPATYLIDKTGEVRRTFQGKVPFDALKREVDRTLGP